MMIVGVTVLMTAMFFTSETQYEIPYGELVKLIEQGAPEKNPAAKIDLQEGVRKELKVRYHQLSDLKFDTHEITGKVIRQVMEPESHSEAEVAFHTPRVGLENDNNALVDMALKKGFTDVSGQKAPGGWRYYMPMVVFSGLILVLFLFMMRRLGGTGSA
ncbi:MAG: hypothetical protein ABSG68_22660, partial [Thermoguttaceae bacterium]